MCVCVCVGGREGCVAEMEIESVPIALGRGFRWVSERPLPGRCVISSAPADSAGDVSRGRGWGPRRVPGV
ncbi:hypothetical protein B296_00048202 [Ensete ventricosum]|uniref:Uncharacterized protein n=1 Tax=Ensete ventricosum TaxID=4639 RepID=A0A426YVN8_ENSVE|nr:hypothetical protein B296_00048202 [Ensete ventricosum]